MAFFSRRKKQDPVSDPEPAQEEAVDTAEAATSDGPRDISLVDSVDGMHNFGVLHLPKKPGIRVQFTINKRTRTAIGALVQFEGSAVTLNLYAAPKNTGLWHDIREELSSTVSGSGGTASFREGPFGPEIEAMVPKKDVNEIRHVRYVGFDGPRWFLRATIEGDAVTNADVRAIVDDYFREIVVDRGSEPHPARDLLELEMPDSARERVEAKLGKLPGIKTRGPELPELA